MTKVERLNKTLTGMLMSVLRVIPMVLALCEMVNSILGFLNIEAPALAFIGGTSFIPLLFIYLASWVFKFCTYHRLFLYYVFVINCINVIDYSVTIPVSNYGMLIIIGIITGLFLFLILYFRRAERCYRH